MNTLGNWLYQPQEKEGSYEFSGTLYLTVGVQQGLSEQEIFLIYRFIKLLVFDKNNLDYLQVFVHKETGQKLFFIDQLNKEMVNSGHYSSEDNYCTLLFAHEY
ncbi:hypothetical protein [Flavobacterium sp.]|uniref:hypothetical protein n=1 Tax=Flavobacterium sp. TaxID=239 RepID=UPI00260271A8|nr:hypothetical protein [Flavobacterium sp.]MDD2986132.1 hypothetical protein [Flavobacterium sp.]